VEIRRRMAAMMAAALRRAGQFPAFNLVDDEIIDLIRG